MHVCTYNTQGLIACSITNGIRIKPAKNFVSATRNPDYFGPQSHTRRAKAVRGRMSMKDEYDFTQAKRGAVNPPPPGKRRITIRLDDEVIEWFRQRVEIQGGGNYQTMINQALREYIFFQGEQLEQVLRRVVREELENYR
jgi:uncharacterized protein (DUF4415 family)